MAKPRIFVSSTFYDLKQIRTDLDTFIESVGYDCIRNEEGDIPYGKDEALEEYCYKEIKNIDILVSIIGGRFGSESRRNNSSISQIELRAALKENKQVYVFIERNVLAEYETYLINKDNAIKFRHVDDARIYKFIEEIKNLNNNNNIKAFDSAGEITKYLKDQFAGLFQRFLDEQTRIKEVSLIRNLEKTAQTLNKLVNFLSDENKEKEVEINRILMINHPLIEQLRTILKIPYNFFIEGFSDMVELLNARGYEYICEVYYDEIEEEDYPEKDYYSFNKHSNRGIFQLNICIDLFDDDNKLKFIKKPDWEEESVFYREIEQEDDDNLPF